MDYLSVAQSDRHFAEHLSHTAIRFVKCKKDWISELDIIDGWGFVIIIFEGMYDVTTMVCFHSKCCRLGWMTDLCKINKRTLAEPMFCLHERGLPSLFSRYENVARREQYHLTCNKYNSVQNAHGFRLIWFFLNSYKVSWWPFAILTNIFSGLYHWGGQKRLTAPEAVKYAIGYK